MTFKTKKKKKTFNPTALLVPYKPGSQGCKLLSKLSGIKRTKVGHVKKPNIKYFHWGDPTNKLDQYKLFSANSIACPEWTTEKTTAESWLANGDSVMARTILSGHSGAGIIALTPNDPIVNAPVYTKYVKKQKEFRVHIAFDKVIDIQEKRKKSGEDVKPSMIRNHQNGYVYCRENIIPPPQLEETAKNAAKLFSSHFSAVDLIWNEKFKLLLVLEVNTAPGLTETTALKYAEAIKQQISSK